MRVLHVITGLAAGGAEQQLGELVRHSRYQAEVVALTNAGALAEEIRADGVPVTDLGMRGNADVAALPRLTRLISRGRFDVVHTHLYRACLYGRLAARAAGVRTVVATEHSLGEELIEGRPVDRPGVRRLYLLGERLGRMTVAVSPTVARLLRRWGVRREKITMIPNGLTPESFRFDPAARDRLRASWGVDRATPVVGSVGRLAAPKHPERLLAVLPDLPGAVLLLVGDGEAKERLRRLAADRGLADRVIFTGETRELAAMYSAMDVHASASPAETFGLATLEAMAAGLPTVYACCPALDDLPEPAPSSARRVSSDVAALRAALREAIAGLVPGAPRAGLTLPAAYHSATVAARVDALYDSLYAAVRRRPPRTAPARTGDDVTKAGGRT